MPSCPAVHGDAVAADTRVNPDGTLDMLRWARPQHDGPALRALTLLRWARVAPLAPAVAAMLAELLRADLRFCAPERASLASTSGRRNRDCTTTPWA